MNITKEEYERMRAALKNIADISQDQFAVHQAKWGLGIPKGEDSNG